MLTGEQRLELTAPNVDHWGPGMNHNADPEQKRDFLADLDTVLEATRRDTPDDVAAIAYMQKVNDLAQSLAPRTGQATTRRGAPAPPPPPRPRRRRGATGCPNPRPSPQVPRPGGGVGGRGSSGWGWR